MAQLGVCDEFGVIIGENGLVWRGGWEVPGDVNSPLDENAYLAADISNLLPIEGWLAGLKLIRYGGWMCVCCLHDRWGRILHQWTWGYVPHWADIPEVTPSLVEVLYAR